MVENIIRNDMVALSIEGRYRVTPGMSIIVNYSQPLTNFNQDKTDPEFSLGADFGTLGHAFQIFATNYHGIVPQYNYSYNHKGFWGGEFLIGFNITKNYNFQLEKK